MRRLAAYGYSYLACALLLLTFFLADFVGKRDDPEFATRKLGGVIAGALVIALLSLPMRLTLGLFPEPSRSPVVRLLRRMLLGLLCGPFVAVAFVTLLPGNDEAKGQDVVSIALLAGVSMGLLVGLVDSLHQDSRRPRRRSPEHDGGP